MARDDTADRTRLHPANENDGTPPSQGHIVRRLGPFVAAAAVIAALAAWGTDWVIGQIYFVHIVDARIDGDVKTISTRLPGFITDLAVTEGDRVKHGDHLARIDDREAKLQLLELDYMIEGIDAQLAQTRTRIELLDRTTTSGIAARRSGFDAAQAEVSVRESELKLARDEFARANSLRKHGIVSTQRWQARQTDVATATQARAKAYAEVAAAAAALDTAEAARSEMEVLQRDLSRLDAEREILNARRERKKIEIEDMTVISPIDAVIDKTFVSVGEFVQTGQRLLLLHNPDGVWVEANVKETQVRKLRLGQTVTIDVDAYPGRIFMGTLARIGNVTTSQFALLPAPNPSGNFTKVTQRVPIRVALDQTDGLLRPGMMVELEIDVSRQ